MGRKEGAERGVNKGAEGKECKRRNKGEVGKGQKRGKEEKGEMPKTGR